MTLSHHVAGKPWLEPGRALEATHLPKTQRIATHPPAGGRSAQGARILSARQRAPIEFNPSVPGFRQRPEMIRQRVSRTRGNAGGSVPNWESVRLIDSRKAPAPILTLWYFNKFRRIAVLHDADVIPHPDPRSLAIAGTQAPDPAGQPVSLNSSQVLPRLRR